MSLFYYVNDEKYRIVISISAEIEIETYGFASDFRGKSAYVLVFSLYLPLILVTRQ